MRKNARARFVLPFCVFAAAGTACSDEDIVQPNPSAGTLDVTVATDGVAEWIDPDGYALSVGAEPERAIGVNGRLTLSLSAGNHRLALTRVALSCTVEDPNPRTVTILGGETTLAAFEVSCPEPPAPLRGRIAFWSQADGTNVHIMNVDGSGQVSLTDHPEFDRLPAVSPDGRWVLFTSTRDGNADIYVMRADGSGARNLTAHPAADDRPRWSPDGTEIAFTRNLDIFVMNADGSDPVNLTNNPAPDNAATWSPDGSRIAFTTDRTGNFEIFVMNADGSDPVNLTDDPGGSDFAPAWSPDGTKIAFTRDPAEEGRSVGPGDIFVMGADGSDPINLTNHGADDTWPSWSPDGSRIAFASDRTGDFEVFVMQADGSAAVNVSNRPGSADFAGFPQAWSP